MNVISNAKVSFECSLKLIWPKMNVVSNGCGLKLIGVNTVPSPRGAYGDLAPQTKLQDSPNWKMKLYKSVEFWLIFWVSSPVHKPKAPPQKCKAPYWKLSGDGSVSIVMEPLQPQFCVALRQPKRESNWWLSVDSNRDFLLEQVQSFFGVTDSVLSVA